MEYDEHVNAKRKYFLIYLEDDENDILGRLLLLLRYIEEKSNLILLE